eukprot:m.108323 g.108323  ORF g.108323 m.108323 type:complete len:64 (+) comp13341_c1_seq5:119-310(+)
MNATTATTSHYCVVLICDKDLDQRIQGVQQENQELKLKSKKLTVCIEEFVAAAPPSTTDPDKP